MGKLPWLNPALHTCESPHIVLVGAGASRAACLDGDANGMPLPVMADLAETTGSDDLLRDAGWPYVPGDNFELVYQKVLADPAFAGLAAELEARIRGYFERIQIPEEATLYDRLLLSLREKDVIASFNWDPLLVQAFKRNRHVCTLPHLIFLHGNVDVGVCVEHHAKGFLEHDCNVCGGPLSPVKLLYPIGNKNYEKDPFIRAEWNELRANLNEAYILTIIGYAAPASDVEAKRIMLKAWRRNKVRDLAEIEIVDIKSESELAETWRSFTTRTHYGTSKQLTWLLAHPRRSCDHFAMASLQQRPCRNTPLPLTNDLNVLQTWIERLLAEEAALREEGTPFPC